MSVCSAYHYTTEQSLKYEMLTFLVPPGYLPFEYRHLSDWRGGVACPGVPQQLVTELAPHCGTVVHYRYRYTI